MEACTKRIYEQYLGVRIPVICKCWISHLSLSKEILRSMINLGYFFHSNSFQIGIEFYDSGYYFCFVWIIQCDLHVLQKAGVRLCMVFSCLSG